MLWDFLGRTSVSLAAPMPLCKATTDKISARNIGICCAFLQQHEERMGLEPCQRVLG